MINNAKQLTAELDALLIKSASLHGYKKSMEQRRDSCLKAVGEAKARDELKDEIARAFNALQNKAHQRSVGTYEELLTYLLKDVLPDEGSIHLRPEYKRNETWLDLYVKKPGSEHIEGLDANGGALTNVVSTGLRFISLSKTNNRKLLILDEPDCWVETARVESFYKVISEVSASVGFQTFFISHKPAHMFEENASVVVLKRQYLDEQMQGFNDSEFISEDPAELNDVATNSEALRSLKKYKVVAENRSIIRKHWANDDEVGIRAIELINVRQHSHTVIPCFPGANAVIGGSNVGKSTALIAALRAICYGECDDSIIQHDKDEAIIILHLEKNQKLKLSRKKGRSPPLIFSLLDAEDNCIQEGKVSRINSVPEWVKSLIGVARVDDMDVQLVSQKSPVFLLEESGPKRAKILSVGTEAENLNKLMKYYETIKVEDRETIKRGEAELDVIAKNLKELSKLEQIDTILAELSLDFDEMWENFEFLAKVESVQAQLNNADKLKTWIDSFNTFSIKCQFPEVPSLRSTTILGQYIADISIKPLMVPLVDFPVVPVLGNTSQIVFYGRALYKAIQDAKWANFAVIDFDSHMRTLDGIRLDRQIAIQSCITAIAQHETLHTKSVAEFNTVGEALNRCEAQLHECIEQLGGICPTCEQHWPKGYIEK